MTDLAKLVVRLEAQSAQFTRELEKTNEKLTRFERQTKSTLAKVKGQFLAFGKSIAGALSVGAVGGTLNTFVQESVKRADDLGTLAKAFGTTAEEISRLDYVARQSNTSIEEITSGLGALQKNLVLAGEGSGRARKAIAALGIDARNFANLPLRQQLEGLADAFVKVQNPADRMRIAAQLFGDEVGRRMIPILSQGSAGIKAMAAESDALGNTLTQKATRRLQEADEQTKKLQAAMNGLKTEIAVGVTPALVAATNALSGWITAWNDGRADRIGAGIAELEVRIRQMEEAQRNGANVTYELAKAQKELGLRYAELNAITGSSGPTNARRGFFGYIAQAASDATKKVRQTKQELEEIERFLTQSTTMRNDAASVLSALPTSQGGVLNAEEMELRRSIQDVPAIMVEMERISEETFSSMSEFGLEAARNMQDAFANFLFDPFKGGLKGMLGGFVDTLRRMVAEIASQQILMAFFNGLAGMGGFAGAIGSFFGGARAGGGPVSSGKAYMVGEKGPEMFVPGTSGRIVPGGGGMTISPTYNIDARGATQELAKQLPAILAAHARQTVEMARRAINDDVSRGAFGRA